MIHAVNREGSRPRGEFLLEHAVLKAEREPVMAEGPPVDRRGKRQAGQFAEQRPARARVGGAADAKHVAAGYQPVRQKQDRAGIILCDVGHELVFVGGRHGIPVTAASRRAVQHRADAAQHPDIRRELEQRIALGIFLGEVLLARIVPCGAAIRRDQQAEGGGDVQTSRIGRILEHALRLWKAAVAERRIAREQ